MRRRLIIIDLLILLAGLFWPWITQGNWWRWIGRLPGDIFSNTSTARQYLSRNYF